LQSYKWEGRVCGWLDYKIPQVGLERNYIFSADQGSLTKMLISWTKNKIFFDLQNI
jgi:hypothetical protein